MPQIGSGQGIDVPEVGTDSDVEAANKIVNALTTLIAAVEGHVPISAVDWTSDKSAGNNSLSQLWYLGLSNQGNNMGVDGVIYNKAGDLYWTYAGNPVQLTSGASLNAAGIGGIVGDYGGGNPAKVTFIDASSSYEFTTDPGVYADVKCNRIIITGSGAGVTMLDSAATASQVWTLPALPASQQTLQVDAAGAVVASNTFPVAVTLSGGIANNVTLTAGATLPAGQTLKHGDKQQRLNLAGAYVVNGSIGSPGYINASGALDLQIVLPHEAGTRCKQLIIRCNATTGAVKTADLRKLDDGGASSSVQSTTSSTVGWHTITLTLGTPEAFTTVMSTTWYLRLTGFVAGDVIGRCDMVYDRTS